MPKSKNNAKCAKPNFFTAKVRLKCKIWLILHFKMPVGNASDAQRNPRYENYATVTQNVDRKPAKSESQPLTTFQ